MSVKFNAWKLGMAQQSKDWADATAGKYRMLLLRGEGSPLKGNATVAQVLAEADVDEANATGYERQHVADRAITLDGDDVKFTADDVAFGELGGSDGATNNVLTWALIYEHNDADDAQNIPVVATQFSLQTNGSPVTIRPNPTTNAYFRLNGD